MTDYAIQPNNLMLQFWNWLTDKGCEFHWIDHHITAIQNLKHLNIPGFQTSAKFGCMNTWYYLEKTTEGSEVGIKTPPMCIRFASDYDIWNKNSEYSWDKQLHPMCYFIESLGTDLNNNDGELVQTCYKMLYDNNYTNTCINIGKYIFRFLLNKYKQLNRNIYQIEWNDYNCLIVNSTFKGSLQFEQHEQVKEADILITWFYNGTNFQYSLYTSKPNINVGELAQQFLHGGGHAGAAGGETKDFIFHQLLSN